MKKNKEGKDGHYCPCCFTEWAVIFNGKSKEF
jgi:hypothetical protein